MPEAMFYSSADCDLEAFKLLTQRQVSKDDVPLASEILRGVPLYDGAGLTLGRELASEWSWVLGKGPGALAVRGAYSDTSAIDAATRVFNEIIEADGEGAGDHFAKAGTNARVWNASQKLCMAAPEVFAAYFGNPILSAVCEAWLGPGYQMTAQVNLVRPGGAAQQAHRDYHLGFLTQEQVAQFPMHVHHLSATLTLQGAIAHCDMPIESGPTKLLPHSQLFGPGYLAYTNPDFRAYFEQAHVQVPLSKGDLLFFNPALFHAAGENRSADIQRMANLVQVSSAFGRAMETLDRAAMIKALYPALHAMTGDGRLSEAAARAAIASAAEGYSFPTNLDTDPPLGGLAPKTPAQIAHDALSARQRPQDLVAAIDEAYARRRA